MDELKTLSFADDRLAFQWHPDEVASGLTIKIKPMTGAGAFAKITERDAKSILNFLKTVLEPGERTHVHESSTMGVFEHSHPGGWAHAHFHDPGDMRPKWYCGCPTTEIRTKSSGECPYNKEH